MKFDYFSCLPLEMIQFIFIQLCLSDLLICRKVCKNWKNIVDLFKTDDLVIYANRLPTKKWFYLNDQVNCRFSISVPNLNLDLIDFKNDYFIKFKSLYIDSTDEYFSSFDIGLLLNHLIQLERLEIINLNLRTTSQLTLPDLKTFSISSIQTGRLILNTPELENLRIVYRSTLFKIDIVYPNKIKWFESLEFDSSLFKFVNLEHLFCKYINHLDIDFYSFKKLIQISFDYSQNFFDHLLKQMKNSKYEKRKQPKLNVYFMGFKFETSPPNQLISQIQTSKINEKNVHLFEIFYPIVSDILPFIKSVNYTALENRFENSIPKGLGKKLVNFDELILENDTKNKEQFLNFVKQCSKFPKLILNYSSANIYSNLLEEVCPNIQILETEDQLPFNFIVNLFKKFPNLYLIKNFDKNLDFEFNFRFLNDQLELITKKQDSVKICDQDALLIL